MARVRVKYFSKWPNAVLFYIPEGEQLDVRGLKSGFDHGQIKHACGDVDIAEGSPGVWSEEIARARKEARAERSRREQELRLTMGGTTLARSVDLFEHDRDALKTAWRAADDAIRRAKNEIARIKSDAAVVNQVPAPEDLEPLERELLAAKQWLLDIEAQLGSIRRERTTTFERAFVNAAREMLSGHDYRVLLRRAALAQAPVFDPESRVESAAE